MRRIALLVAANMAVMFVLNIVLLLIEPWLRARGIDVQHFAYLFIALVFGMGGALISLLISKSMAIRGTGAHVIDSDRPANDIERWLVNTVRRQAKEAGIGMPDVAIYDSPDVNAFATGASRNNALVAVSTGLVRGMRQNEAEAVLGHEVSHVANGDMITMTLLQGVLNTFVILLSRIIGQIIDKAVFRSDRGYGPGYFITVIVLQIVLGFLASLIVMAFSRWREFRADAGGAKLSGRNNMIAALERLRKGQQVDQLPESVEAFGISGRSAFGGLKRLMMSHPPLEERIRALSG